MKTFLFILFPSLAFAGGPKYNYPTPRGLDDEMHNIYHDIQTAQISFPSYTLVQLKTISPARAGLPFYCSDCVTSSVCVSTGTAIYGFSDIGARANSCK